MQPNSSKLDSGQAHSCRIPGRWSQLKRAIEIAWKASPMGVTAAALVLIASAILPVAMAWVGKLIVDAVVATHNTTTTNHVALLHRIWLLVFLEFALAVTVAF